MATVLSASRMLRAHSNDDVATGGFDPLTLVESAALPPRAGVPAVPVRERGFVGTELRLLFRLAGLSVVNLWGGTVCAAAERRWASVTATLEWGMRYSLAVAVCTVMGTTAAYPCSSFISSGPEHVLLAKNFDWHLEGGYLVKSPRGMARRALPLFPGEPATWVSTYGSLTMTQYGVGLPYGGVNEPGLAIEMLWLDETVYNTAAPKTIGELEWIQFQLDTRSTVAEVVEGLDEFSIHPVGGKIHYVLADATGDKALIEFVDGLARVHRGDARPLVTTNDTRRLSELAFERLRGGEIKGNSSRVRYARLRLELEALETPPGVAKSFEVLDRVAERGSPYRTQWSVVYDLRARKVHLKSGQAKRAVSIDMTAFDYAQGSGITYQDLQGKDIAAGRFLPLDQNAQRSLLARDLPELGLGRQVDAIAAHLLDPSTSNVRPAADRATLRVEVRAQQPGAFARIAVFRNQGELSARTSKYAGSVLLDVATRQFAFYNLPKDRYAVGAYHDLNQNGRHDPGEPLAFFRPNPLNTADTFADLAFDLAPPARLVEITFRPVPQPGPGGSERPTRSGAGSASETSPVCQTIRATRTGGGRRVGAL